MHRGRMTSNAQRLSCLILLAITVASCNDTDTARRRMAEAQKTGSSNTGNHMGGMIDPMTSGMEAPETRQMREMQATARDYRASANTAQGPERERFLQLAENLEQQVAAMRKP